jgi:4a-hydroxytetrahydrobiopterin dehydratase
MMNKLSSMSCKTARKGDPALSKSESQSYLAQIPEWRILEQEGPERLFREFKFKNFVEALNFTNQVGELAEQEDHHPALLTEWGKVTVTWWTHVVNGLHLNDFIAAAKTEQIYTS